MVHIATPDLDGKIMAINKRYYPTKDGNIIQTVTVLVGGSVGDYAAYTGHGDPEWVAAHGDKIGFTEAAAQFIPLERERYRD